MAFRFPSLGRELLVLGRQALLLRHDVARPVVPSGLEAGQDVAVCLHGVLATAGVLRPLRKRLQRNLGVATATFSYAPSGHGVEALARRLSALLESLPATVRIHLVGHSLGGVVARHYAVRSGDSRIVQTVSLAAPFAGVGGVAAWGAGLGIELARDLCPQSELLRELRLNSGRAVPHVSILASDDAVLGSPRSHALPGGDVVVVDGCGHNGMLYHEGALEALEERVGRRCSVGAQDQGQSLTASR